MTARTARLEVISGMAGFVVSILTWAIWLFAPLYAVEHFNQQIIHVSLVDAHGGLGDFARQFPSIFLFILAFLVVSGVVACGAYLHGRRFVPTGETSGVGWELPAVAGRIRDLRLAPDVRATYLLPAK